jgi:hypothetical protein
VRVVNATDLSKVDVLVVERLGELIDGLIAALGDRFLDLNLQDEMAATLKIEAKLDAVGDILLHLGQGRGKYRHSDNTKNTKKNHNRYESKLPRELGIHAVG